MVNPPEKIFALFGNPVGHSLSPLMHSAAFKRLGISAQYVPFSVHTLKDAVAGIRGLDIQGVSVTLPFKETVIPYLDEVEECARQIGAVNTILNREGRLMGFNTDWRGLVHSLKNFGEMKGKTFAVVGAGGAARAALYGILKEGGLPILFNRNDQKGEELAGHFGCRYRSLSSLATIKADWLIHTTPVGMAPDSEKTLLRKNILGNFKGVMDMIYNPLKTLLLKEAGEAGSAALSGLDMFVHQGAEQIRIWTGMEPPRNLMRQVVLNRLKKDDGRLNRN